MMVVVMVVVVMVIIMVVVVMMVVVMVVAMVMTVVVMMVVVMVMTVVEVMVRIGACRHTPRSNIRVTPEGNCGHGTGENGQEGGHCLAGLSVVGRRCRFQVRQRC